MIGIFDSGFGGLTVLKNLAKSLPGYNFVYLGDNARAPYGNRSFESIYRYTLEAVSYLFSAGCPLVILACNTASAKALRTIQQKDLPLIAPKNRVLGIIRPMAEEIGNFTKTGHIGILGTEGTINSNSYLMEIAKFWQLQVEQEPCPMLVPLVEKGLLNHPATEIFVKEYTQKILSRDPRIDTLVLGCTHYPLLQDLFVKNLPKNIKVLPQGPIVAQKTLEYLANHPEIETRINKNSEKIAKIRFLTTDSADFFERNASLFWNSEIKAEKISTLPE
ncbi:MAG: glutamate racemase [Fibromonadaceae bacterium]|jgi:glutamate racemase|nr:glutamate racemase [Fibromonadaceae bacterium]